MSAFHYASTRPEDLVSNFLMLGQDQKSSCRNIIMLGQTFSENMNGSIPSFLP